MHRVQTLALDEKTSQSCRKQNDDRHALQTEVQRSLLSVFSLPVIVNRKDKHNTIKHNSRQQTRQA